MSRSALLPDVPGFIHGIVSLDPPTVQCDGCGHLHSRPNVGLAVLTSRIIFNARATGDARRMCTSCWNKAGWEVEI